MERIPVRSSLIRSVGYVIADQLLEVQFHNGAIYHYRDVPEEVYTALRKAPSLGSYLNQHIRDQYPYEQVD